MHSVLVGACRLVIDGVEAAHDAVALAAYRPHRIVDYDVPYAAVAYVDPRRFEFEAARRLANTWRTIELGVDDLREAAREVMDLPERLLDWRVRRALDAIETGASVEDAAAAVRLSPSRLTHLTTETLGAPPRMWSTWFKLQRAIQHAAAGHTLTVAAHHAGFADSAHLTRTCKRLTGVLPGRIMPEVVHVLPGT